MLTLFKPIRLAFANNIMLFYFDVIEMGFKMTLREADKGAEYIIKAIETDDEEMDGFLFSLGCYTGESITLVSHLKGGCVVFIKDGRDAPIIILQMLSLFDGACSR